MDIPKNELVFLQRYLKNACGLIIPDDKDYLLKFRLTPIIEDRNLKDYNGLCGSLRAGDTELRELVITALTTHETFFFRDNHPFNAFKDEVLPWLEKCVQERKNKSHIRKGAKANIWCAASSTGQEPYSLAMLIHEYARARSMDSDDISILATDVSNDVLSYAMKAVFSQNEVERGADDDTMAFRKKFFTPTGSYFELSSEIKQMVDFKYCNLMDPLEHLGGFDVIFSRNVLIYFDEESKKKIIQQFYNMLSPDGYLILGSSENLYGLSDLFRSERVGETVLYRK